MDKEKEGEVGSILEGLNHNNAARQGAAHKSHVTVNDIYLFSVIGGA
jgi:hypothetical protein